MFPILEVAFWAAFKLLLGAFGILYAGLVLMAYRTEGERHRLRLDKRDPAGSAAQLLVWAGVRAMATVVRVGRTALEMLSDASAEVGEWYIRRRGGQVEAIFRSHFL
jgi:hypothetical protein